MKKVSLATALGVIFAQASRKDKKAKFKFKEWKRKKL